MKKLLYLIITLYFSLFSKNLLLNPGCEDVLISGDIPSWVEETATTWTQRASNPDAYEKTNYFFAGACALGTLTQIVDISTFSQRVDYGIQEFVFSVRVRSYDQAPADFTQFKVEYLASDTLTVLDTYTSPYYSNTASWDLVSDRRYAPAGTRNIKISLTSVRNYGTNSDGYFDDASLEPVEEPVMIAVNNPSSFHLVTDRFNSLDVSDFASPAFYYIDNDNLTDMLVGRSDGYIRYYEQSAENSEVFTLISSVFLGIDFGTEPSPSFTDLDNDGTVDMLVGDGWGTIDRYEQTTQNSLNFVNATPDFNSIDQGYGASPVFTDLDGDGLYDMLLGVASGKLCHYEQNANNSLTMTLRTTAFNSIDVGDYSKPAVTDLDRDGLIDLIIGNWMGNVYHYEQSAVNSTTFTLRSSNFNGIDVGMSAAAPAFTDIDGDGLLDLLIGDGDGYIEHYEQTGVSSINFGGIDLGNSGDDHFTLICEYLRNNVNLSVTGDFEISTDPGSGFTDNLQLTSLEGKAYAEIYVKFTPGSSGVLSGIISIYSENAATKYITLRGSGIAPKTWVLNMPAVYQLSSAALSSIDIGYWSQPEFTDFDGDGLIDLLVGSGVNMAHYEQTSLSTDSFALVTTNFNGLSASSPRPSVIDIDNDGLLDLIISSSDRFKHYEQILENSTSFSLVSSSFSSITGLSSPSSSFSDLDSDGLLDILIGASDGTLKHYEQTALNSYSFTLVSNYFNFIDAGNYSVPEITDLDQDGLLDLLVGNYSGTMYHYEQDYTDPYVFELLSTNYLATSLGTYLHPECYDIDGDGIEELFAGTSDGKIIKYDLSQVTSLSFGETSVGLSTENSYLLRSKDVVTDLEITAPSGFKISADSCVTFNTSIQLSPVDRVISQVIYVKFEPENQSAYSGNVSHSAQYAENLLLPVSGTGVNSTLVLNINKSGSDLILNWDPYPGATSYKVYSSDDPYGTFTEDISGTFDGETWTVTYADSRKFYYITAADGK